MQVYAQVLGPEHRLVAGNLSNWGSLLVEMGLYAEARKPLERAMEIEQKALGPDHPDFAISLTNLARVLTLMGAYAEAELLYVKSLEIMKQVLGEANPDTLKSMRNLANLYKAQGKMDDARPLVRALLEATRWRADRPEASGSDKNVLAWVLLTCEPADLRDPPSALEFALAANEQTAFQHPGYLDTLALAYHLTGDTAKAVETLRKALALLPEGGSRNRADYETRLSEFTAELNAEE